MSMDSYAVISYAALPEDDFVFPWDNIEYDFDIIEWWKKNKKDSWGKEGNCPYEVIFTGNLFLEAFSFLCIRKTHQEADEWSPKIIDMEKLSITELDKKFLSNFCEDIGMKNPEYGWCLSSYIG